MSAITDRMDAAIERAKWRYPESKPKLFYLDAEDWRDFDQLKSDEWGSPVYCFSHRDIQIRSGKRSRLVTDRGCLVCVPKHLSPHTKAA